MRKLYYSTRLKGAASNGRRFCGIGPIGYFHCGQSCFLYYSPPDYSGHHMDHKGKERIEQDIRSARYYIHCCYHYLYPIAAVCDHFVMGIDQIYYMKNGSCSQILRNVSKIRI